MSLRPTVQSPIRWPFWLLLAAWLCANTPQTAAVIVLTWLGEARTFSHHERLTRDVAFLVNGETAPGILATVKDLPSEPQKIPLPAQLVLKKIDLGIERTCEVLPPALRPSQPWPAARICPDPIRAAPPHEPPRSRV